MSSCEPKVCNEETQKTLIRGSAQPPEKLVSTKPPESIRMGDPLVISAMSIPWTGGRVA